MIEIDTPPQKGSTASGEFTIKPRGPFSWAAALELFGNFPPVQHHLRGAPDVVRLTFPLDGDFRPVAVALTYEDGLLRGEAVGSPRLQAVAAQVARIFSLDHDATAYPEVGRRDPRVGALMQALPGLRPVCFTSPYETAAWGVISQRISMRQAAVIKDWLIADHGELLTLAGGEVRCFPTPDRLARLEYVPGLSKEKVGRLRAVAAAALEGRLDAGRLRELGDEAGPASVLGIPGIGPFWASGIYLRGCGIADVFPDEPISVAALGHLHQLGDRPSTAEVARLTEVYRPFRMWVCFLLRVAVNRGLIAGVGGREGSLRRAHQGRPKGAPA